MKHCSFLSLVQKQEKDLVITKDNDACKRFLSKSKIRKGEESGNRTDLISMMY